MYGEDNTEINKCIKIREAFFKKYHYHCFCFAGVCICKNCHDYYSLFGKIRMIIKSWLRKKKAGVTYGK